jgi:hypothetical protein
LTAGATPAAGEELLLRKFFKPTPAPPSGRGIYFLFLLLKYSLRSKPAAGEELLLRKFFKPTRASFLKSGAATPAAGAPP